jgi:hypothetical protein
MTDRTDDVAAHDQTASHRYVVHFPPHPARTSDPHYVDFNHYHRKTRRKARCYTGERVGFQDCRDAQGNLCVIDADGQMSGMELHHAHIEFALQQGIALEALEKDYPGISNPEEVGAWVESEQNFRWLCVLPGSPVLMADGSQLPIEYVRPGDRVITHDGTPQLVEAVGRKRYRGEVAEFNGAALTVSHRVLTDRGWISAAEILHQVRMHGPDVIRVRGEQQQVSRSVVGSIAVEMVDALAGTQRSANELLHDVPMLEHPPLNAVAPDDHADVSLGSDMASTAIGLGADLPLVQSEHSALIGAVHVGTGLPMRRPMEGRTADGADQQMRWVAPMFGSALYTGWVHDLSVSHNHSFIVGGIAVHNCVFHHRTNAGGAHAVSHSDWEGSQYIRGLTGPDSPPKGTP